MSFYDAPSARSAMCYRQISARLGHAVAKASVMQLLGISCLPVPASVPQALLARNCPGLAVSFSSFPQPHTYASSLFSLFSSLSPSSPPPLRRLFRLFFPFS